MKRILIFVVLYLISNRPCQSDSLNIKYDIQALHIYQTKGSDQFKYPAIPGYGNDTYDTAYDSPLRHGASTMRLGMNIEYNGLDASFWGLAEHRGFSYGVYSKDDYYIIPRFNVGYAIDSIFSTEVRLSVKVGNFDRLKIFEGLTLNNADTQGNLFELGIADRYGVRYQKVGDLYSSIGYGMNDFDIFTAFYSDSFLGIDFDVHLGASAGELLYNKTNRGFLETSDNSHMFANDFSLSAQYKELRLFTQGSINKYGDDENNGLAGLIGLEYSGDKLLNDLLFNIKTEFRYYDEKYNRFLGTRESDYYSGPNHTEEYPIYNATYRLENWGLYQNYPGREIADITFYLDLEYYISEIIGFKLYTDNHFIFTRFSVTDSFIDGIRERTFYNLYKFGLILHPIDELKLFAGLGNYDMNLRSFFPTFSQFETPSLRLELDYTFSKNNRE